MTMQNIADDIEMHVSTVSRAVKGKYIQYPGGTIGMRDILIIHRHLETKIRRQKRLRKKSDGL